MYPILFQIKGFTFYTHGLLAVIGIIIGTLFLHYLVKKELLDKDLLFDNVIYTVLAGIVGARVTYFLLYHDQFSNIKEILFIWDGGMVSFGGFALGGLVFYLLLKSQRQPVIKWFDLFAIAFSLGMVFGRIGNVFAGEYAGVVTRSWLNFDGLVPVNLYESILMLFIFIGLLLYHFKSKQSKPGKVLALFLISYGVGRFIIDIWRAENHLFLNISLGQIVSLLFAIFGILLLIGLPIYKRKVKNVLAN